MWTLKSIQHKQWPKIKTIRLKKSLTRCLEKNMKNLKTKLKSAHALTLERMSVSVLAQDNPSYPKQVQRVAKKPLKNTYKFKDGEDRVGFVGKNNSNSKVICS
jgi:ribosomal protein L30/L7E